MEIDDRLLVLKVIAHIEQHLADDLSATALVDFSGYSLNRLRQKFFNVTGETPSGYLRKRRLTEAAKEILAGKKIIEVSLKYGFSSQENFTTSFRSYFGVTPGEIYQMDRRYKTFIGKLRNSYTLMEIAGLQQPAYNATLMGCLKGAADWFDLDLSPAMLYGLSGHAFLINIHRELCPSGPYCWTKIAFHKLLANLGIQWIPNHRYGKNNRPEERQAAEQTLIDALNEGGLGVLEFLEYQLVGGYDEKGFQFLLPWDGKTDVEMRRLTYTSWEECLDTQGWCGLAILKKGAPREDLLTMTREALAFALKMYREPSSVQPVDDYAAGYGAYDYWKNGIREGHGESHGHWWNGMVWAECRHQGARFFEELGEVLGETGEGESKDKDEARTLSARLATRYQALGEKLDLVKEKALPKEDKISLLEDCLQLEHEAEEEMARLVGVLG